MILEALYQSFFICFILNVWFNTSAFVEYCKYFNLGCLVFYISDYEKRKELAPSLTYISYLRTTFPKSFFIKLIACPICVSFWINILYSIGVSNWNMFFVNCWLSLALYYILVFLSRLSMEKVNG